MCQKFPLFRIFERHSLLQPAGCFRFQLYCSCRQVPGKLQATPRVDTSTPNGIYIYSLVPHLIRIWGILNKKQSVPAFHPSRLVLNYALCPSLPPLMLHRRSLWGSHFHFRQSATREWQLRGGDDIQRLGEILWLCSPPLRIVDRHESTGYCQLPP